MQSDIHGINEVGRNWTKVPSRHQWRERIKNRFESHRSVLAWNQNDPETGQAQWGGTALLTLGC